MAYDEQEIEAAISLLIDQMEGEQGDRREIWMRLQTLMSQLRATGMPVPDDLKRMEADMQAEFGSETPGGPGGDAGD